MHTIHRSWFDPSEIEPVLPVGGRDVPGWLGNFQFTVYSESTKTLRKEAYRFKEFVVDRLAMLKPEQDFNTVFFQRYETGTFVKPHRDPASNIGHTIIAILGEFEGAVTTLRLDTGDVTFRLAAGDVLVLPCTIDGVRGCVHEVSPVLSGTRYAVILNTIETEQASKTVLIDDLFTS